MATERAGAVRAAAQGHGAARRPGTDVEDAPPPPLLLRDAKAVGRRKRGGGGALQSSRRRRNAGPGQTGADRWGRRGRRSLHHTVEPTKPRQPTHTDDDGVVRSHRPVRAPLRSAPGCRYGLRLVVYRPLQTRAVVPKGALRNRERPHTGGSGHRCKATFPYPIGEREPVGFGRQPRSSRTSPMTADDARAAAAAIPLTPHLLSVGATHRLADSTEARSSQLQNGSWNQACVMRWSEEARTEARPDPVSSGTIRTWKRRSRPPARAGTLRRAPEGARRGNHRRQDDASHR